jgi:LemA protein
MTMLGTLLFTLLVLLVLGGVVYFVLIYNGLIALRRNIDKAWSNIDVLLKQRHDEVPRLVAVCQGYMKYERETLEKITQIRAACIQAKSVGESAQMEGQLGGLLKNIFAVAENYPDLKANQNFLQLQERISYLESQIADRRELFNDSVNNYNIRINQIPDMWVAGMMGMTTKELFKVIEGEKQAVDVVFNPAK